MGTGYVIDHRVEWTASRDVMYDRGRMVRLVTVLTEVAADQDLNAVATEYRVTMDHMQLPVMSPALHEGPVLANLLEWYGEFYDWAAPVATERTELFGTPALLMSAQRDDGSWEFAAMGWRSSRSSVLVATPSTSRRPAGSQRLEVSGYGRP